MRLVHAVSREAGTAGVRPGGTVALAQAMTRGLTVIEAQPAADLAALERIALWALRYSPLVALEEADGFVLDTGGVAHLFGGEDALLADLFARLEAGGLSPRAFLSSSRLLSQAMARCAPHPSGIVAPGEEAAAAGPLPVAALGMDAKTGTALHRLGFKRIGDLFAAPRKGLAQRFGLELVKRLDCIRGDAAETLEPVHPPELVRAELIFAEPVAHLAGIETALGNLAERLCASLAERQQGARLVDLHWLRVDNAAGALRVGTSAANRDPAHLCRLFGEKLATIDPGFGIERMALAAPRTERIAALQIATHDERQADLAPLIDRISARIGAGRVFRLAATQSDLPERSLKPVAPLAAPEGIGWDRASRPVQLIVPPERIEVIALLPDHPPARFTWRGKQRRVARADGPECIAGEWWRSASETSLTRDYYRVEDEAGGRWWLFRARNSARGTAEWFVHGVFG